MRGRISLPQKRRRHNSKPDNSTPVTDLSGLVLNKERYSAEADREVSSNSVEALIGLHFSTFRFDSTEFTTELKLFPSVSPGGRFRLALNSSVYLDLVGDLYCRLSFYENFDSSPPVEAPRNDFGITTSIGWKF